jgi:hypothetical protein
MNYLLSKGELLMFDSSDAIEAITVRTGRIWLTQYGDQADYCLEQGAAIKLGKTRRVAIEAVEDAAVSVIWREAPATFTITLGSTRVTESI